MAIPFINALEHYVSICILLTSMWYYFTGAYETFWSIYTILVLLILIKKIIFMRRESHVCLSQRNALLFLIMIIISWLSFLNSTFHYYNGFLGFVYILLVAFALGNMCYLSVEKLYRTLQFLAIELVLCFLITMLVNGTIFVDGRLTIANDINVNTFGKMCAQLSTILFISMYFERKNRFKYLLFFIIVFVMAFLSGSRGALLASICAVTIIAITVFMIFIR